MKGFWKKNAFGKTVTKQRIEAKGKKKKKKKGKPSA